MPGIDTIAEELRRGKWEVTCMIIWKLKGCPRCSGDLFIYRDMGDWNEQCLQCCYWRESKTLAGLEKQPVSTGQQREGTVEAVALQTG